MSSVKRGTFIVFEGRDKVGKTTQLNELVARLKKESEHVMLIRFPERSTRIGKVIDSHLAGGDELNGQAIHLLFSANRWELKAKIISAINSGVSVCTDRYVYSGVAYSAAKRGLDIDWCKQADRGLPCPDVVCFLETQDETPISRAQYGKERYENPEFQRRVKSNFELLQEATWVKINGDKTRTEVHEAIYDVVRAAINMDKRPLGQLWMNN